MPPPMMTVARLGMHHGGKTRRYTPRWICNYAGTSNRTFPRAEHGKNLPIVDRSRRGLRALSSGGKEERHIADAVRRMREMKPRNIIEVRNALLASSAGRFLPPSVLGLMRDAAVNIKCLTRADLLCDEALRLQVRRVEAEFPGAAVLALDLSQAEDLKQKKLAKLKLALLGARLVARSLTAVVCGLPNAGKSSLILPLTKARTLQVRKKKSYHLPKISKKAGTTMGSKRHVLEVRKGSDFSVSLVDTPGLRPRLDNLNAEDLSFLFASGVIESFGGMLRQLGPERIVGSALEALKTHATFSGGAIHPNLGAIRPTDYDDAHALLDAYVNEFAMKNRSAATVQFIQKCRAGAYGGMMFEIDEQGRGGDTVHVGDENVEPLPIHRQNPIVCLNASALRLVQIGSGNVSVEDIDPAAFAPPMRSKSPSAGYSMKKRGAAPREMKNGNERSKDEGDESEGGDASRASPKVHAGAVFTSRSRRTRHNFSL